MEMRHEHFQTPLCDKFSLFLYFQCLKPCGQPHESLGQCVQQICQVCVFYFALFTFRLKFMMLIVVSLFNSCCDLNGKLPVYTKDLQPFMSTTHLTTSAQLLSSWWLASSTFIQHFRFSECLP